MKHLETLPCECGGIARWKRCPDRYYYYFCEKCAVGSFITTPKRDRELRMAIRAFLFKREPPIKIVVVYDEKQL
jgi:hypothetical protein